MNNTKRSVSGCAAVLAIVGGCLLFAVSSGIRSTLGIIMNPLVAATGLTYAEVSLAMGVMQLVYGVTQPLWGIIALRRSNFFVLALGIPLFVIGLVIMPLCQSATILIVFLGLLFGAGSGALCFGIIMGAISLVVSSERAAVFSGILNASIGVGCAVAAPLIQFLNQIAGLELTVWILAAPMIALLAGVVLAGRKASSLPAAARTDDNKRQNSNALALFRKALRSADYRALLVGFSTCGFHMCIIMTHFVPQMIAYGIAEQTAAFVYTVFSIFDMAGAAICGVLCSKLHLKTVLGSLYGIRVLTAIFMLAAPKTLLPTCIAAALLGLTADATVTPTSEIIRRRFGAATMAFLFGVVFVGHQIGGFVSSWAGGVFISASGNYTLIWMIDIVLCALAALASFRIRIHAGE